MMSFVGDCILGSDINLHATIQEISVVSSIGLLYLDNTITDQHVLLVNIKLSIYCDRFLVDYRTLGHML